MRNGIVSLLIAGALLASTAFAGGTKLAPRPQKSQAEVAAPAPNTASLVR
jgi:hypothetical protein